MPDTARLFHVSGRVQGVFFRASTRDVAGSLGLRGYAINLDDGRVEVLAVGDADAVDRLAVWLERGPPAASVERVESDRIDDPGDVEGFQTG